MDEQRMTPVAGEDSTAETQRAEETGDRRQETGEDAVAAPVEDASSVVEETGDGRRETGEDAVAAPVADAGAVVEETGDRRQETGEDAAAAPVEDASSVVEETGDGRRETGEDAVAAPVEDASSVVEETGDRRQETEEDAAAPVADAGAVVEETGDRRQETGEDAAAPVEDAGSVVEETGDRRQETEEDPAAPAEDARAVVEGGAAAGEETGDVADAAGPVEGDAGVIEPKAETADQSSEEIGDDAAAPHVDEVQLKAVIEAIVYVAEEPSTAAQIAASVRQPEDLVKRLLDSLVGDYSDAAHGVMIREVAGGYKMATKPEHHDAVRAFAKSLKPPLKLSLAALETLATIAYKQPMTAPEIMEIRGVQGAGVLKTLLDRKLIQAGGRKNVVGRPILYRTTKEFLVQFGLKDLSELPTLKEFEELRRLAVGDDETAPAAVSESEGTTQETRDRRQETGEEPGPGAGAVQEAADAGQETEVGSQETGEEPAPGAGDVPEAADAGHEPGEEPADEALSTEKDG